MTDRPAGSTPAWERVNERPHVVIVTDDPDLRDFLAQGLLLAGFWTSAIASGIQAIEVFRLRRFDLVLIDAQIRGLPATEIVGRLRGRSGRGREPLTRVPICIIAADADRAVRTQMSRTGVDGFLDPPLELEEVAVTLRSLLATWRASHPGEPWADASVSHVRGPRSDPAG